MKSLNDLTQELQLEHLHKLIALVQKEIAALEGIQSKIQTDIDQLEGKINE